MMWEKKMMEIINKFYRPLKNYRAKDLDKGQDARFDQKKPPYSAVCRLVLQK